MLRHLGEQIAPARGTAKQPAGMTLIELLVAMLLFVVGCMAFVSLQIKSMNAGQQSTRLTTASFLAEAQLERIQAMEFNEVQFVSSDPEWLTREGADCPDKDADPTCYSRVTTITPNATTSRSCYVSVQVAWPGGFGGSRVVYDSVVSDFGL